MARRRSMPRASPVPDETESAKAVWDVYYANHQKAGSFKHLKLLDCFMGGGTTLVEGSRLGFQIAGVDLNPIAWFVVKNEVACTDPEEVRALFEKIESEVKPAIQPLYVTDCPLGHAGRWYCTAKSGNAADDKLMPTDFDPLALAPSDRVQYRYEGPEVIYTFWAKHGHCSRPGCDHRTPIFRSPVIAEKKLGVKYIELTCKACKISFHAELGAARMAPDTERVVLESELPFTELSQPFSQGLKEYNKGTPPEMLQRARTLCEMVETEPGLKCPMCGAFAGQYLRDVLNRHANATRRSEIDKKHLRIEPPRNGTKHVYCYLLIDPDWLNGTSGLINGAKLGGYADATVEATSHWYEQRLENLRLIEIRGRIKLAEDKSHLGMLEPSPILQRDEGTDGDDQAEEAESVDRKEYGLPRFITLTNGRRIDTRGGTIPQQSHFTCGKCGLKQDARDSVEKFGHNAPVAPYAIQGYCPHCDAEQRTYGGRFFAKFARGDQHRLVRAEQEWMNRRDGDLADCWPRDEIPYSYMTHHANFALPRQGYTHWWKMFNARQLLLLASLLKAIQSGQASQQAKEQALGAFQQYLRMQNMFVIWHQTYDKIAPFLSNPNFAPKARTVENNLCGKLGYGTWSSCAETVLDGLSWCLECTPWGGQA
jgi:putative DNA methylase